MTKGFGKSNSKKKVTVADDPKLAAVSLFLTNADPHKEVFLSCGRFDEWTIAIIVSDAFMLASRAQRQEFLISAGKNYVASFDEPDKDKAKLAIVNKEKTQVLAGYDAERGAYFSQGDQSDAYISN